MSSKFSNRSLVTGIQDACDVGRGRSVIEMKGKEIARLLRARVKARRRGGGCAHKTKGERDAASDTHGGEVVCGGRDKASWHYSL